MFDLSKALSGKSQSAALQAKVDNSGVHCTFIYQTQECLDLVQEVFRFEGWDEPKLLRFNLAHIAEQEEDEIILFELSESNDVVEDAKRFASKLPTHKGIIVIGKEDSILTIRALREIGFYYMLWPFSKSDLADFLMHVEKNLKSFAGVSEHRKAKRVAVVGAKGGLGVSFICCELASYLSIRSSDTIVVDHHGNHSNMDVLLSLDDFSRQNIDEFTVPIHELDEEGALSYLIRVRQNLRLLALDSEKKQEDVLQYTNTLYELLSRSTNFVIEDFSGSVDFEVIPQELIDNYDVVVVVSDASVSSVRNARVLLEKLKNARISQSRKTRLLTVVNHHRPHKAFVLHSKELENYLGTPVDLLFDYCSNLSHIIVDGKSAHKHDRHIRDSICSLASLIQGQPVEHGLFSHWLTTKARK